MAEDEVRDLIRSVARRGTALGVSTLPEEIRHNLSHSRHAGGHRIATASVLRRRLTPVFVAAIVLAVFFVPVPHVSLFNRLVAPTKSSTVPSTVPSTSSTSPGSSGPSLAGIDGPAAWALSATQLSVSDDGGLDWSAVALPAGVDAGGVTSVVQAPNGELFLAAVKGSTVRLYRKASSTSAGWSYTTLVPSWSSAATGFAFQTSSVMITPGPTGMVTVVVTDELSHTEAIPRLFVSLDDGATFRQYPTPARSNLNRYWSSVTFITPASGLVVSGTGAGGKEALFHTSDGGTSWTPSTIAGLQASANVAFGTPFAEGSDIDLPEVTSSSDGAETLSLYVSGDDGATFTGPIGRAVSAPNSLSPLAVRGQSLWVVHGDKVYKSANDGQTWTVVTTAGLPEISAMSLTSASTATAVAGTSSCAKFKTDCTSDTYFVRTTDGGQRWNILSDVPTGTAVPVSGLTVGPIWPVGANTVWAEWGQNLPGGASGGAQGLERSTDGGKDWTDVTPPGLDRQVGDHFITDFYALDTDHAWVTYGGVASNALQTVASTSDSGRHWKVEGRSPSTYGCELQFVTALDGWCAAIGAAAGSEGVDLYRTEDGGKHWRLVSDTGPTTGSPGSLPFGCDKNIQFVSPSVGWAVFSCNGGGPAPLYESTNGGRTWVSREVTKPSGLFGYGGFAGVPALVGADGAVGYTFQLNGSTRRTVVYVSTDAGASWHAVAPPGRAEGWLVDTMTPLHWRLVNGDHILATDDGGRTWHTITSNVSFNLFYDFTSPGPPVVDFVTNEVGWIVSTSGAGTSLWRTTDGGSTWRRVVVNGHKSEP